MSNCIKLLFLLFSTSIFSQNIKIIILDKLDNKPITEIQIFSENGSLIGNSNSVGEFEFELSLLQQQGIKSIMIYDRNYLLQEFSITKMPKIIYLTRWV
jgi:predicted Rossmann fold nucleotide-binding protein DprA/Smf involved in DNA uptake